MRTLPAVFFVLIQLLAGAAERIVFARPMKPGDVYEYTARSTVSTKYALRMPGESKPVVTLKKIDVIFNGVLTIEEVNKDGAPTLVKCLVKHLSGGINGVRIAGTPLENNEILCDLKGRKPAFSCVSIKYMPTKNESALLAAVFKKASGLSISSMTGAVREASPGESWQLDTAAFCAVPEAAKLGVSPKNITGIATFRGRAKVNGAECHNVEFLIQANGLSGVEFRIRAGITFPLEDTSQHPSSASLSSREIVERTIPDSNQFAGGGVITFEREADSDSTMRPCEKPTAGKSFLDMILR